MRRLVIASACFLVVTGLVLTWQDSLPIDEEDLFISLLHIWVGFLFIVIFPMYAIDHLNTHRSRLGKFSWTLLSGSLQLISGIGLVISGLVILLWGNELKIPVTVHYLLTFTLSAGLIAHWRIPKNK
jgi:hypothetical protein